MGICIQLVLPASLRLIGSYIHGFAEVRQWLFGLRTTESKRNAFLADAHEKRLHSANS
jgi:hypothetical protein